jgi:hypothetical protein
VASTALHRTVQISSVRQNRSSGPRDDFLQGQDVLLECGASDAVEPGRRTRPLRLPTKALRMSMYPASSRIVSCLDSAESDSPMLSRTNPKSAHSVAASSETIDNRVGAWISSSNLDLIIGDWSPWLA